MTPFLLAVALWQAFAVARIANGGARRFDLPVVSHPASPSLRAGGDYWRPAGPARRSLVLGVSAASGDARFDVPRRRASLGPLALDSAEVTFGVFHLLRADDPNPHSIGPIPLAIADVKLENDVPDGVPRRHADPDWRTPRLQLPRPPPFEVVADDHRIELTWNERRAAVSTTVIGGPHRWQRTIIAHPTHLEVRDTVTNGTTGIVGLRVRHAVATDAARIHLGGRTDIEGRDAYDPWNPTVFTPLENGGLGLVAEDDVFRQQLHVDFDTATRTAGLRTDMLCLGPTESYTIVWSVYPSRTSSYWDFINAVRVDWRVNATVHGSHVWFTPDQVLATPVADLAAALAHARVSYASMLGGWIDPERRERPQLIGFGTFVIALEFARYRSRIETAFRKLKSARPLLHVLAYFDTQRDSSPEAPARYADSVLRAANGRVERVDWNGRYSAAWGMVPTQHGTFGRAMLGVARRMRELGADGLYWDEMDGVDYREPRATTTMWDRHSCVLARDGSVRQKIGLVNLLSETAKLRYARAGLVLGNVPPTTRRFQRHPAVRMVEVHHHPEWSAFAHLTTPLGYIGADRSDWSLLLRQIDAGLLPAGGAWSSGFDLPGRLFPFTPQYIQPGTLRGRERIVTTRSGTHGWAGFDGTVRSFHYDASGREKEVQWRTKHLRAGTYVRVNLAPGEAAVIERDVGSAAPSI